MITALLFAFLTEVLIQLWLQAHPLEFLRTFVAVRLPKLSLLLFCPYCLSFHFGIILALFVKEKIWFDNPYLEYILAVAIIHRGSNLIHKIIK